MKRRAFAEVGLTVFAWVSVGLAQTTYNWVSLSGGTYSWTDTANWDLGAYPNGAGDVARFVGDYVVANMTVTMPPYADVPGFTLHGLVFSDTVASHDLVLSTAAQNLSFAALGGNNPYISNTNRSLTIWPTVTVNGVTANLIPRGSQLMFRGPVVGNGTLISMGTAGVELFGAANSNFTGTIIVSNAAGVDARGGAPQSYWLLGDTNGATEVYGTGYVRLLRDAFGSTAMATNAEPVHVYGVHANGSVRFYANSNALYLGAITLHTNGVINYSSWFSNADAPVGAIRHFYFNGAIVQDDIGYDRNLHILRSDATAASGTGTLTRLSHFVLLSQVSHEGYTHIANDRDTAQTGSDVLEFASWLRLTNGNDRLPTGTTVYLGGRLNAGTPSSPVWVGGTGSVGILLLAGVSQELAGLMAHGTGTLNRVINYHPTDSSTLTLNIGSGANIYSGYLGGIGGMYGYPDDPAEANNLDLVKKGAGTLVLQAPSNTYAGTTTVEAGTLIVNADQRNSGLITVQNLATLGGTGRVGAVKVLTGGILAPGMSPGVLSAHGNVTLEGGSVFSVELNGLTPGTQYDQLHVVSGSLSLQLTGGVRPDLGVSLGFTPALGDVFDIVTGLSGFDPSFDGYFEGKPDLSTFSVGSTQLQIDYQSDRIRLTVVPEPSSLGLIVVVGAVGLLRRRLRG